MRDTKITAIQALDWMSKYAGNRLDFVQAGGGNTSVKLDDCQMMIKASGWALANIDPPEGTVIVDYLKVKALIRMDLDNLASTVLTAGVPSIETYLHAVLGKFVLHTHAWVITGLAVRKEWESVFAEILSKESWVGIPYHTPGLPLARAMVEKIGQKRPGVIVLQNHGLIVTAETAQDVIDTHERVIREAAAFLQADISAYQAQTQVQNFLRQVTAQEWVVCAVQPVAKTGPILCPDTVVFCGFEPAENISAYYEKYQQWPKIVVMDQRFYAIGKTLKKVRDTADVWTAHVHTAQFSSGHGVYPLSESEKAFLTGWDAEKWRQSI